MKYFYGFLLLTFALPLFGQTKIIYVNKEGKYTGEAGSAISYVLIRKLADSSAYSVKQFDMHDTILVSGTFKDELLETPHGKFVYYHKNRLLKNKIHLPSNDNADTNNYIKLVGYFLNGKRAGKWISYASRNTIEEEFTFENDRMNGPYKKHFSYNNSWSEGTMVNDSLEGKYNTFSQDSLLVSEAEYLHDKQISYKLHLHEATERPSFAKYLEKKLKQYRGQLSTANPVVKFTVSKTGEIKEPEIVKGINPEIDKAMLEALATAPSFNPANYDYLPVQQKVFKTLFLFRPTQYFPNYNYPVNNFSSYRPRPFTGPKYYRIDMGNGLVMTEIEY